jgi:hypothetical protein
MNAQMIAYGRDASALLVACITRQRRDTKRTGQLPSPRHERAGAGIREVIADLAGPDQPHSAATALTSIRNSSRTSRSMMSNVFGG